ncbi:hypothetical protein BQ8794_230076 [Mesorhizobium prunaredense]|uniref:Uncharacterized protein n=1 Tax=Mesorhizobium prunaredense TaxID=1631249 RepID=A0A1R3V788_9HYPH|nr:hypothetical protein BQ8794_230076 [Mesorhizobium prunaredense]
MPYGDEPRILSVPLPSWAIAHAVRKEGYSNGFQSIRSNLLDLNVSENCRCYPGHSGVIILRYTYVQYVCLTAFARNRTR